MASLWPMCAAVKASKARAPTSSKVKATVAPMPLGSIFASAFLTWALAIPLGILALQMSRAGGCQIIQERCFGLMGMAYQVGLSGLPVTFSQFHQSPGQAMAGP